VDHKDRVETLAQPAPREPRVPQDRRAQRELGERPELGARLELVVQRDPVDPQGPRVPLVRLGLQEDKEAVDQPGPLERMAATEPVDQRVREVQLEQSDQLALRVAREPEVQVAPVAHAERRVPPDHEELLGRMVPTERTGPEDRPDQGVSLER